MRSTSFAVAVLTALTLVGCSSGDSPDSVDTAEKASSSSDNFDIRTATCTDYAGYDSTSRNAMNEALLQTMSEAEGLRVTDALHNQFSVGLINGCNTVEGTTLLAIVASKVYVAATGGG